MKKKVKDILKEHVHQHEYTINPEEIFVGALAEIKKEKKDKRKYLLFFLLFFGVSVFMKLYFSDMDNGHSIHNQLSDTSIEQIDEVSDYAKNEDLLETTLETQVNTSTPPETENENETTTIETDEVNQSEEPTNNSRIQEFRTKTRTETSINEKLKETKVIDESNTTQPTYTKDFKTPVKQIIESPQRSENTFIAAQPHLPRAIHENQDENVEAETNERSTKINDEVKVPMNAWPGAEAMQSIDLLNLLTPNGFVIGERDVDVTDKMYHGLVEIKKIKPRSKFALSIIGSYGLFDKTTIAKDAAQVITQDLFEEKPLEILSSSFLLSYTLSNSISLSSGIKWQQINEEFAWNGNYNVNELGDIINEVPGAESLVGMPYSQEVEHTIVDYTKRQLVSVPVLIGYSKRFNAFSIGANAGPSLNVYSKSEGRTLNELNLPVTIESLSPTYGLGVEGNVELGYAIAKRTDLLLNLSFQHLESEDILSEINFNSLSLGLGFRKGL